MRVPKLLAGAAALVITGLCAPYADAASLTRLDGAAAGADVPAPRPPSPAPASPAILDTRHIDADEVLRVSRLSAEPGIALRSEAKPRAKDPCRTPGVTPPIGTVCRWAQSDFRTGTVLLPRFRLRAVGRHIEAWVQTGTTSAKGSRSSMDLDFPAGDCRNGERTRVADAQIARLVRQFDARIYPRMSSAFSTPQARNGAKGRPGFGAGGAGDKIVTLITNIRDDNFYDRNNARRLTYISGYYSSEIKQATDRNVMTIDAWDWLHRTGPRPPDEPSTHPCTNAPARPYSYEAAFAHEYQHLLMSDEDPDEVSWVNEGLSDHATRLLGYSQPARPITSGRFDAHIQCFLGWLAVPTRTNPIPLKECGPENSLTVWGDQGDRAVLADYGAAYSFMEMLADRYGPAFMKALHRDKANGLRSLHRALVRVGAKERPLDLVHAWLGTTALDRVLDRDPRLQGGPRQRYSTENLRQHVRWSTPEAYASAGAPPNGADFVRLRDARGRFLSAAELRTLAFRGSRTLPAAPVQWRVDADPDARPGNAALYSGTGDSLDRSIVRPIVVPTGRPSLSFDTRWSTEPGFDSGFVQISTDGGKTYTSLSNDDTKSRLDPEADPLLKRNLPGFNGRDGWKSEVFDLSAYAGRKVLLAFRYISDEDTNGSGWWIDNVRVNGRVLSDGSSLSGWRTRSQIGPGSVTGFTVQLVAYKANGSGARIARLPLPDGFTGALSARQVRERLGSSADLVAALVTYDDPSEKSTQYARYSLSANGVVQPGG